MDKVVSYCSVQGCSRDCKSRIGLYSHTRRCTSTNTVMALFHSRNRLTDANIIPLHELDAILCFFCCCCCYCSCFLFVFLFYFVFVFFFWLKFEKKTVTNTNQIVGRRMSDSRSYQACSDTLFTTFIDRCSIFTL